MKLRTARERAVWAAAYAAEWVQTEAAREDKCYERNHAGDAADVADEAIRQLRKVRR